MIPGYLLLGGFIAGFAVCLALLLPEIRRLERELARKHRESVPEVSDEAWLRFQRDTGLV